MILSFVNVTKNYYLDEKLTITPVNDVTLNVEPGEFILMIGRSGSGKTTFLNLAAGLIHPTKGKVLVDGVDLKGMSDQHLSALRCQQIGFVFQFPSLLPTLNVLDNVALPSRFIGHNGNHASQEQAAELLKTVGLAKRMKVFPKQLSSGEQKRVVIARALINNPRIILADEPTSDLDVQTENEIMALFRSIHAKGVTIIMVTHSLELIPYATRALKMENGVLSKVSAH